MTGLVTILHQGKVVVQETMKVQVILHHQETHHQGAIPVRIIHPRLHTEEEVHLPEVAALLQVVVAVTDPLLQEAGQVMVHLLQEVVAAMVRPLPQVEVVAMVHQEVEGNFLT